MLIPYQFKIDISAYFNFYSSNSNLLYRFVNFYEWIKKSLEFIYSIRTIGYVWLIGVVVLGLYKLKNYNHMRNNVLKMSSKVTEHNTLSIYQEILNELDIKQHIQLRRINYSSVPFGIGVIKKYIILPDVIYTEKELKWILRHELTHFKYHDISIKLLMMVVSTLYWFDPLIYIVNRVVNNSCEIACDERVLRGYGTIQKQEYAITILESVTRSQTEKIKKIAATLGRKGFIKARVQTMFEENLRRGIGIKVAICILIFLSIINISIGFGKFTDSIQNIRQNNIFYLKDVDKDRR